MQPSVYLETTIISYLTARPSRNPEHAERQQVTRDWWDQRRDAFETWASIAVLAECMDGDWRAARRRVEFVDTLRQLPAGPAAVKLGDTILRQTRGSERARWDALHIAIAAVHDMDYLMSWNLRHIANPRVQAQIAPLCAAAGYRQPILCTPRDLQERHRAD